MLDEDEADEMPGYVIESLGPPIECGVIFSAKTYMHRFKIPPVETVYPPGDYISAYTILTAKVGDLPLLSWAIFPTSYWGFESNREWEDAKAEWREYYDHIAQRIQEVMKSAVESIVKELNIGYVEYEFDPGGVSKIKKGPKKRSLVNSALRKRRWERFVTALPDYQDRWQKARDSEDARDRLPEDLIKVLDERWPNRRHKYKPHQVALVHLARDLKVLGVGSQFLRIDHWMTVKRSLQDFLRLKGNK